MVTGSNAGSMFSATASTVFNLFSSKGGVGFYLNGTVPAFTDAGGNLMFHKTASGTSIPMAVLSSGVTVSAGLGAFQSAALNPSGVSNKYYAMSFNDSGTKYGWVHVVSSTGNILIMDLWSYNAAGGTIKTLSDSVTTSRLALTGGKEKLHWSNDNEDGVARYEVQSKDASGAWQAADSDVPGSSSYSAKIDSGKTCRLVVEMTDGSTKEIDF
jgi:hypothetical protein